MMTTSSAMGTRVAPSLADIYMAWFEKMYIYTYPLQPLIWMRFLDDCFCIWQHGWDELSKFTKHINNCHANSKFTMEASTTGVNFLDTTVKLKNGKLTNDLYCKLTDSHNYLLYTPQLTLRNAKTAFLLVNS